MKISQNTLIVRFRTTNGVMTSNCKLSQRFMTAQSRYTPIPVNRWGLFTNKMKEETKFLSGWAITARTTTTLLWGMTGNQVTLCLRVSLVFMRSRSWLVRLSLVMLIFQTKRNYKWIPKCKLRWLDKQSKDQERNSRFRCKKISTKQWKNQLRIKIKTWFSHLCNP